MENREDMRTVIKRALKVYCPMFIETIDQMTDSYLWSVLENLKKDSNDVVSKAIISRLDQTVPSWREWK